MVTHSTLTLICRELERGRRGGSSTGELNADRTSFVRAGAYSYCCCEVAYSADEVWDEAGAVACRMGMWGELLCACGWQLADTVSAVIEYWFSRGVEGEN